MSSQSEIKRPAQRIHIGALIGTRPAWILFQRRVARSTLVTNKEQRARPVRRSFSVTEVHQNSRPARSNADIIGLDIAVNNWRALAVQKSHRIANREKPLHQ